MYYKSFDPSASQPGSNIFSVNLCKSSQVCFQEKLPLKVFVVFKLACGLGGSMENSMDLKNCALIMHFFLTLKSCGCAFVPMSTHSRCAQQ